MFGGKGHFVNIYETGDELFGIMCALEKNLHVRAFFVMDENFLLHKKRALRLLALMEAHGKAWSLYVFSSARVLRSYTMEQLVRLGVSWLWMGLEGKNSRYVKLARVDTHALVKKLQSHGIRVLGSTIIGLEEHTPENIDAAIDHAVSHATDFHQFMLYTPIPGTPLYAEHLEKGTLRDSGEYEEADIHGQLVFRHHHPHIKDGQESAFILNAFQKDFATNGPSVLRIGRTILQGWRRYKNHPDTAIRDRFTWEARELVVTYPAILWASCKWYRRSDPPLCAKLTALIEEIKQEIGLKARLAAPLAGRVVLSKLRKEDRRLKDGLTYEPPTFYEMNEQMAELLRPGKFAPALIKCVAP